MSVLVDIESINKALAARLESWLPGLIGGQLDRIRSMWIAGHKRDGGPGSSLEVTMKGVNAGVWVHYAAGRKGGDALGLVNYIKFGDADMKAAFAYARDTILQGHVVELTAAERAKLDQRRVQEDRAAVERRERIEKFARRIFLYEAKPEILGTPVEWYFRDERRLDLRRFPYPLRALRYHPALEHPQLKRKLPAMVAAVVDVSGPTTGIHRVWLTERNGRWDRVRGGEKCEGFTRDGEEIEGKLSLGTVREGAIRLWAGQRMHPATGEVRKGYAWADAPEGSSIALAEAIEEGVTIAAALPKLRVAVPTAVSGLRLMKLPPQFSNVTLFGNRDAEGSEADQTLQRARVAREAEGRVCTVVQPPAKDWNAWWIELIERKRSA